MKTSLGKQLSILHHNPHTTHQEFVRGREVPENLWQRSPLLSVVPLPYSSSSLPLTMKTMTRIVTRLPPAAHVGRSLQGWHVMMSSYSSSSSSSCSSSSSNRNKSDRTDVLPKQTKETEKNPVSRTTTGRSRPRSQPPVKSTTAMDDFFARLGTNTLNQDRRSSVTKRRNEIRPSTTDNKNSIGGVDSSMKPTISSSLSSTLKGLSSSSSTTTTTTRKEESSTKLAEMSSFFDEINRVVAENKKKEVSAMKGGMTTSTLIGSKKSNETITPPSILDLMPPDMGIRGPNAFDEQSHDEYIEILDTIIEEPKLVQRKALIRLDKDQLQSVMEWLRSEEPVVDYHFPVLAKVIETSNGRNDNQWDDEQQLRKNLRREIQIQQDKFREKQGWNNSQYEVATRVLHRMGNICSKKASGLPAEIAWEKLKEMGYCNRQDIIQNYLYVLSTFATTTSTTFSTSSSGSVLDFLDTTVAQEEKEGPQTSPKQPEEPSEQQTMEDDAVTEIALLHDILFGASEASTSIRVRKLVSLKRPAEAEALLDKNADEELRLRTYEPVFRCYLENQEISSALKLYVKMKRDTTVFMKPETYIQLMSAIAENGFFRSDSRPIEGALEIGFISPSGPKLFDRLAEDLSNDSVEISASGAKRLYNGLLKGLDGHTLKPLHLLQSLEVCNEPANPNELVASRVTVDETNGRCPRTGVQLRLINLDGEQKERLKNGLQILAKSAFEERTGKDGSKAEQNLEEFGVWLANRTSPAFTAIVDGANVGYYFQNFDEGRFNYNQIEFVVETLENMGENVLVTIPSKYTQDSFTIHKSTGPKRQTLTQKEKRIRDRLNSSGKLLIVPPSYLDDYYWMYASVAGQGDKFVADQQYIQPNNDEGRWPGIRPMLISNDKMRDHKLSLLEPRLFRRWYSNFIVNYTFSAFVGEQCPEKEIGFRTADFYSREIQGNEVSIDGAHHGTTWHFPVSDWEENESFCVRIPH